MMIVNDRGDNVVFSEELINLNIHSGGTKIMASPKDMTNRPFVLAEYDTRKKAERAFNQMIIALAEGQTLYKMPDNEDPQLNTSTVGGGMSQRKLKTTGKTK